MLDFRRVARAGKKLENEMFSISYLRDKEEDYRVVVSKKLVKGAVRRNVLKRRFKEILRKNLKNKGLQVILWPRKESIDKSYQEINKSLKDIFNV